MPEISGEIKKKYYIGETSNGPKKILCKALCFKTTLNVSELFTLSPEYTSRFQTRFQAERTPPAEQKAHYLVKST